MYFNIGIFLFILGVFGVVFNRENLIIILMSIELMLLAVSFLFINNAKGLNNIIGQLFALMILTVAASESAIGLAIFIVYYRIRGTISVSTLNLLRG
jgi:NADH-quinone oxidoreductase subunit K